MSLNFPLSNDDQRIIEQTGFQKIKALTFVGGLPVYTSARNVTVSKPTQAEMWIETISGSFYICSYINGAKYQWKQI